MAETAVQNDALVFVKPRANCPAIVSAVEGFLRGHNLRIVSRGETRGPEIARDGLLLEHYGRIARVAHSDAAAQNVDAEWFRAQFGEGWDDVVREGRCASLAALGERFSLSPTELLHCWEAAESAGLVRKAAGGTYVAPIADAAFHGQQMYLFNGFFQRLVAEYTAEAARVSWFRVAWSPADTSWRRFREDLIGPTNCSQAPPSSLRAQLAALGSRGPDGELRVTGTHNGVHVSASPLEAIIETECWARELHPLRERLRQQGIDASTVNAGLQDPGVHCEETGGIVRLFDMVENMDTDECARKMSDLWQRDQLPAREAG